MKNLLTTAAILVALVAPAMALEPSKIRALDAGNNIVFKSPRPLAVGCSNGDDAVEVAKFHRRQNENALQEFLEWIDRSTSNDRFCIVLNASPDNSWKVVKSEPVDRNRGRWACLQAKYDFRPVSEQNVPSPCLWIYFP
jgi:hypothetical protein